MAYTKQLVSIDKTNLFSNLFIDYLHQSPQINPFYNHHFSKVGFERFFNENTFEDINRTILTKALHVQASLVKNTSEKTTFHISALELSNTYTVTTGHQLCLFTGPLYVIYKIISTINLCKTLQQQFPDKKFVPVYWMASEDHDFEEINHAHVFGKKLIWNTTQKGAVGEFNTEGLQEVIIELKQILGSNAIYKDLVELFEEAYLKETNLANASRYIMNAFFEDEGLVIIDGNDSALKTLFKKEFEEDAFNNTSFKVVSETIETLSKNYTTQVKPRKINIFYKEKGIRERVEKQENEFVVLNTNLKFTAEEFKNIINASPEKLSPNVVLRPLYQQKILPNIAYVGGPGEIAYWLEYKTLFTTCNITLPVLVPRQFAMLIDKGIQTKMEKLNIPTESLFKNGEELVKDLITTQHNGINLEEYKTQVTSLYANMSSVVATIDKTLVATTEAEKQKVINGITILEQKINKALKQKSEADINQIWSIKEKLFPVNIPQERYDNFSMHLTTNYKEFIKKLSEQLVYNLDNFEYNLLLKK